MLFIREILSAILFCCLPLVLPAQLIYISEPVTLRDNEYYKILPVSDENVLLFRADQSKVKVIGYDKMLRERWDKDIELDKRRPNVISAVSNGNDFYVFYEFRQKMQPTLKVHRYSAGANLIDSVTIHVFDKPFFSPNYQVVISEDKQIALLYYFDDTDKVSVFSFNLNSMAILWETNFILNDFLYQRDFMQMLVDNDGNMYLVLEKDNRKSRMEDHRFEVYANGDITNGELRWYIVPMPGYLTFDAVFSFDNKNNTLVAGGLYGTESTLRTEGFFLYAAPRHNLSQSIALMHAFDEKFVSTLVNKDAGRLKNLSLSEISVQDIVHRQDGGLIMIAERNKRFQRGVSGDSYYSRSGIRPIIDYYYDDIFVVSMHPDGALHWKIILHKKQFSQDDDGVYSSYFLAKTPTALRLVFNDEIKNENTVSEYIVYGDGSFDHRSILNTEQRDINLLLRHGVQVSADAFILPSERRQRLKLVKIVY